MTSEAQKTIDQSLDERAEYLAGSIMLALHQAQGFDQWLASLHRDEIKNTVQTIESMCSEALHMVFIEACAAAADSGVDR